MDHSLPTLEPVRITLTFKKVNRKKKKEINKLTETLYVNLY